MAEAITDPAERQESRESSVSERFYYKLSYAPDQTLQWDPPANSKALAIALSYHFPKEKDLESKMRAATKEFLISEQPKKKSLGDAAPRSKGALHSQEVEPTQSGPSQETLVDSKQSTISPKDSGRTGLNENLQNKVPCVKKRDLEILYWNPLDKFFKAKRIRRRYEKEEGEKVARNRGYACEEHRRQKAKCDPELCVNNRQRLRGVGSTPSRASNNQDLEVGPRSTICQQPKIAFHNETSPAAGIGKLLVNSSSESPSHAKSGHLNFTPVIATDVATNREMEHKQPPSDSVNSVESQAKRDPSHSFREEDAHLAKPDGQITTDDWLSFYDEPNNGSLDDFFCSMSSSTGFGWESSLNSFINDESPRLEITATERDRTLDVSTQGPVSRAPDVPTQVSPVADLETHPVWSQSAIFPAASRISVSKDEQNSNQFVETSPPRSYHRFYCSFPGCPASFWWEAELRRHREETHVVIKSCPQPGCGFLGTERASTLRIHMETKHPELRSGTCPSIPAAEGDSELTQAVPLSVPEEYLSDFAGINRSLAPSPDSCGERQICATTRLPLWRSQRGSFSKEGVRYGKLVNNLEEKPPVDVEGELSMLLGSSLFLG